MCVWPAFNDLVGNLGLTEHFKILYQKGYISWNLSIVEKNTAKTYSRNSLEQNRDIVVIFPETEVVWNNTVDALSATS